LALSAINFFGGIAGAVGNLLAPVARLSGLLWGLTAAQGAAAGAGGAAATGGGLSGVFAAATGAASGLGSVLGRLLAFATGPFGGAALAIGAVGTALYDNRDAVFRVGGEVTTLGRLFKTVFDDTLTATGAFGQGLVDKLKPYFAQLSDRFSQTWSSMFSDEISFGQRILGRVLRFTDENAIRAPFNTQRVQEMRRGQDAINQIGMATNYGANTSDGGASYRAAVALIRATVEARISDINRAAEAAVAGINPTDTPGLRTLGITSEQARRSRMIELNSGPADPAERAAMESALGERGDRLPNGPRPLQRPEGNPWGARPGRGGGANAQETFESFRGQLDPSFRVQNQMTTGMRDLAEAQRKGWITAQQRVDLEGRLRESMLETIQALDPRTKAERQLSEATQLLTGMQREGLITDDQRAQRLAVITERLRDNIDPFGTMLRQIQEETGLTRLSSREMEVESQVRQRVQQLRERGVNLSDSETEQLRTALRLQREMTQAQQDREQGLGTWANSFRSIGTEMDKLSEKFTNEFAGALADFVSTGKANFTDLANSIVRDINELIIKNGLRALMSELGVINGDTKSGYSNSGFSLGRLFGGIWGGGGASAGAGAGGGMFDGGAAFGGADAFSSAAGSFSGAGAFREGGYATNPVSRGLMSATAWMDAPQYREGTSNTSNGIPAILHPNEAVIPLSRGRRVPVEMRGGGAPSVRVEMNITTPDANSFRKSQGQIASEAGKVISRASRRNG
ncbi:MAG TPA: phage tail tape measure C-terminal domain-containing protein, partial [Roseomonas sp.]